MRCRLCQPWNTIKSQKLDSIIMPCPILFPFPSALYLSLVENEKNMNVSESTKTYTLFFLRWSICEKKSDFFRFNASALYCFSRASINYWVLGSWKLKVIVAADCKGHTQEEQERVSCSHISSLLSIRDVKRDIVMSKRLGKPIWKMNHARFSKREREREKVTSGFPLWSFYNVFVFHYVNWPNLYVDR